MKPNKENNAHLAPAHVKGEAPHVAGLSPLPGNAERETELFPPLRDLIKGREGRFTVFGWEGAKPGIGRMGRMGLIGDRSGT